MSNPSEPEDMTLDPVDWPAFRHLAHRALDAVLDYQQNIREFPVWRPVPDDSEAVFVSPAPVHGLGAEAVVTEMLQHVAPFPAGHAHPRFWGWVCGTGTPIGMVADMIAAGINASAGAFNDAPSRVEAQLLDWMRELFGMPPAASGIVTSGASLANIIGLVVGRDAVLGEIVRRDGLAGFVGRPVVYASEQVHSSIVKAMQLIGLGRENLRRVAVDEGYCIRLDALAAQIAADREAGLTPMAVVANAGTVNTGAIDDLEAIAELTRRERLWLHVDGAIGALAMLSPSLGWRLRGIEQADSLAFDFHKWLYVPYEAGCVLLRDGDQHRASFSVAASYLESPARGIAARADSSDQRGPQLSRGFKALKVWAQIREHGLDKLGRMLAQNVEHAAYLARLIEARPHLELMAPVSLNIVCFRYRPSSAPAADWDNINQELLLRLQESGIAAPSGTRLGGQFALRVANTNQRSRRHDFDRLVEACARIGEEIESIKKRGQTKSPFA